MSSNIDHQFAIWQKLHTGSQTWFDPSDPDADAPLLPFRRTKGTKIEPWTSNGVRDWTGLRYEYDTIRNCKTVDELKAFLEIYNWTGSTAKQASKKVLQAAPQVTAELKPPADFIESQTPLTAEMAEAVPAPDESTGLEKVDEYIYPDYLINIIYDR